MKFRMRADIVFDAENIDEALAQLGRHFTERSEFESFAAVIDKLEFTGRIDLEPAMESERVARSEIPEGVEIPKGGQIPKGGRHLDDGRVECGLSLERDDDHS